jgi:hypothetical protein
MAAPRSLTRWKAGAHDRTILQTRVNVRWATTDMYLTCLRMRAAVKLTMNTLSLPIGANTGTFPMVTARKIKISCAPGIARDVRRVPVVKAG